MLLLVINHKNEKCTFGRSVGGCCPYNVFTLLLSRFPQDSKEVTNSWTVAERTFYRHVFSPECSGNIRVGEKKICIITNSYANAVQTWMDKSNNMRIQFSHSPPFPFVGNITELNFKVTGSNISKSLEVTRVHMAVIKNVTATLNNSNAVNNKNDFVTFDNITAK
jgi:hypothetical protein